MKIKGKHYFTVSKVIETNDLDIIYKYIINKKRISKENQDKLVDVAIASKDPIFIVYLAAIIQKLEKTPYQSRANLEKLADAIIDTNTTDYILMFSRYIYKTSIENQNKLVDALIKSKTEDYITLLNIPCYAWYDRTNKEYEKAANARANMLQHPKEEYICKFVKKVRWLRHYNIEKLADYMIKTGNIKYICEFLEDANISEEKMLELEKYILENYKKDSLAKILKELNNVELINLIYGNENVLDKFLEDFEEFRNDNLCYARHQTQDYVFGKKGKNVGGVIKTSGFIPKEELKIIAHEQKTASELSTKYKFVDDNINKVLKSERYIKNR